jgi:hypothetical protein
MKKIDSNSPDLFFKNSNIVTKFQLVPASMPKFNGIIKNIY